MDEIPELSLANVAKGIAAVVAFLLISGGLCAGVIFLLTSGQSAAVEWMSRFRRKQ
jgi:hypothetical protein